MNKLTYTTDKDDNLSVSINGEALEEEDPGFWAKRQQLQGINLNNIPEGCKFYLYMDNEVLFPRIGILVESNSLVIASLCYVRSEWDWIEDMGLSLLKLDIIHRTCKILEKKVAGFITMDLDKSGIELGEGGILLECFFEINASTMDQVLTEVDRIIDLINSFAKKVIKQYQDLLDAELKKV